MNIKEKRRIYKEVYRKLSLLVMKIVLITNFGVKMIFLSHLKVLPTEETQKMKPTTSEMNAKTLSPRSAPSHLR